MNRYNPLEIEQKWQARWEAEHTFAADDNSTKPKMYLAEMFPYPSGAGLHVGHVRNFTIVDVLTRFYAQQELNVLRPFGYDTFGLPAENYAIKTGISPQEATATNIANFRKQAKKLGYAIDWSREINTSDPEYYRWTQWCFLKLFEKGLAYQKESYQWWCPVDQTVLANEQVENGCCWRCGHEVEKKKMKQWFFKITAYADELLADIDSLDWPEKIKTAQRNWIGRSEGAEVDFGVCLGGGESCSFEGRPEAAAEDKRRSPVKTGATDAVRERIDDRKPQTNTTITVFTTRPDTLFGATFLVLAPEHPLVKDLITKDTKSAVEAYIKSALKKSEIERQENKEKTGVFTGSFVTNPATGTKIPVWVADYVLSGYGTGAVMGVPSGDERDFEFAKKFDLPIIKVIEKPDNSSDDAICYAGEGVMVNSGPFSGRQSSEVREEIFDWLEKQGFGRRKVTYKMRDWLISRQRYWGCPIPIAYDKSGKPHAIPESQLPVIHPEVKDYAPDKSGRSALAKAKDWLKVEINGEEMTRETDTLDGYACSSWYLWRYVSAHDKDHAWDPELIKYWAPTDIYVGGDHAVAHLLYVRFWCKFFADLGLLPFREPIKKLLYNGYINAPDGKKMSKSKGNVIDPLDVIDSGYGADTLRTYEMFIGPYNEDAAWSTKGVAGVYRFLNRCWTLCFAKPEGSFEATKENPRIFRDGHEGEQNVAGATRTALRAARLDVEKNQTGFSLAKKSPSGLATKQIRHKTIKKVTEDLHRASFNTAVAALMEYVNELYKIGASSEDLITLAKLLKPFAPHLASEMLESLGADDVWPTWDEAQLIADTVEIVVQVNGKLRARLSVPAAEVENEEKIVKLALSDANVQKFTASGVKKHIYIQRAKLLNLVV